MLAALAVLAVVALAGVTATLLDGPGRDASQDGASQDGASAPQPPVTTQAEPSTGPRATATDRSPSATTPEPSPPADPAATPPGTDPIPGPAAPLEPATDVRPTGLQVPAIGLDVPLTTLGLQPDGTVEVPADAADAGWLTASAVPGRTGPAVLVGHVDSAVGTGVFARVGELAPGDEVVVTLDDGSVVTYRVTRTDAYPKDAFPTAEVYGPAPAPVLRLVTCGGTFDRAAGSYEDNVVVQAVLAG